MTDATPRNPGEDAPRARAPFSIHATDLVLAAVLLAICGFLFWATTTFDRVPDALAQNVQPTTFPRLLIATIAIMALFLPFEHARKHRSGIDIDAERKDRIKPIAYVTALGLIAVLLVMPPLGTLLVLVLACAFLPLLWGERRYWRVAAFAILFPLGVLLLFEGVLEVRFEPGIVGHLFR